MFQYHSRLSPSSPLHESSAEGPATSEVGESIRNMVVSSELSLLREGQALCCASQTLCMLVLQVIVRSTFPDRHQWLARDVRVVLCNKDPMATMCSCKAPGLVHKPLRPRLAKSSNSSRTANC